MKVPPIKVLSLEELISFSISFNFFLTSLNTYSQILLLFHLNNIFVVYFSDSLLLLKTSTSVFKDFCFLYCTLLISFFLVSFSNFSTNPIIFLKISGPSQVSSLAVYPFYLTKYFSFPLTSLLFNIFSIFLLFIYFY